MPESTRHRKAFERYFRLGAKRSIERLHEAMRTDDEDAPSLRTLYEWSSKFRWQEQLDEFEKLSGRMDRDLFIAEQRAAHHRHIQISVLLQQKGVEWLGRLDERAVSGQTALRALKEGVRMECDLLDREAKTVAPPDEEVIYVFATGPARSSDGAPLEPDEERSNAPELSD